MRKYIIPLLMVVLVVAFSTSTVSAATLKAKDYMPSTKKTYVYTGTGYYLNSYTFKNKEQYKNGYWYTYTYDLGAKKYFSYYDVKNKYIVKKDGLYTVGVQNQYDSKVDVMQKLLPATFKKGTKFKSTFTSAGGKYIDHSKVISTNEKVKIGKKTYKNVVKVSSTSATNKKEKTIIYYAKGIGQLKKVWSNGEKGIAKYEGRTTLSSIVKK